MTYQEKLIQFNSTEKYKKELNFLIKLLEPKTKEKILDFGCGIGTAVHEIRRRTLADCFGYDVNNYRIDDDEFLFRNQYHFQFDKIYFMHSFSHIPYIEKTINETLHSFLYVGGQVVIISPNPEWLEKQPKENYIADPTVIYHNSEIELNNLFTRNKFKVLHSGKFNNDERLFLIAQK